MPEPSPQWRITQGVSLLWRSWDDEFIVLNSASGDTHQLDPFSAELLDLIEKSDAPVSLEQLCQQLSIDDDLTPEAKMVLSRLVNLDLVESVL